MYIKLQSRHWQFLQVNKICPQHNVQKSHKYSHLNAYMHRHIASYLKEGELILNKNLDKRKNPYQNDQNPNPWVERGGGIHVPIYLKFCFNSLFSLLFFILSQKGRMDSVLIHFLIIKKNVCCDKKWGEQLLSDPPNVTCLTQRVGWLPKQ